LDTAKEKEEGRKEENKLMLKDGCGRGSIRIVKGDAFADFVKVLVATLKVLLVGAKM